MGRFTSCVLAIVIGATTPAAAGTIRGSVFVDRDGNGARSVDEPGVLGAVVAWGDSVFVRSTTDGMYELVAPDQGMVWVRVPDGYRPGPVFARVPSGDADNVDLPLVVIDDAVRRSPLTFVVASDSHMTPDDQPWGTDEFAVAVDQAVALDPPPRFFTIVGDITQANTTGDFDDVERITDSLAVPWIPVSGNHDWYDGGAAWRERFGPDTYSFDIDNVHFVVWNSNLPYAEAEAFFRAELALVDPTMTVVAMGHEPAPGPLVGALRELGVDYLLTGHWHANRVVDHGGGLIELNTQTFIMGGIDFSPAGYRVVTIDAMGDLSAYHRTVVDEPYLTMVSPPAGQCASPDGFELIVAAEVDAASVEVTASIDCGGPVRLLPAGGWTYRTTIAGLAPGRHSLDLRASGAMGETSIRGVVEVCGPWPKPAPEAASWPQLQGGPEHHGATEAAILPPLEVAWTQTLGGHVHQGAPIIADGTVYVSVSDFGAGNRGGVVALDLATGVEKWRHVTERTVRNAPAYADGIVVVGLVDGEVRALNAATGQLLWWFDLSADLDPWVSAMFAPPTIADGVVYAGVQRKFVAIDLNTGLARWAIDPTPGGVWHGSFVAPTVSGGIVLGHFDRDASGVLAVDQANGQQLWRRRGGETVAMGGAPVIDGDIAYVANGRAEAAALDLVNGNVLWRATLAEGGFDWGFSTPGTPALADGRLFIATQYRDIVALDAATGVELWRFAAGPSPVHTSHYKGSQRPGFQGSPLVTGDVVWIGGSDGRLYALDAATGDRRWSTPVGAPILSGLAAAGNYLVVPSWDGTLRAYVTRVSPEIPASEPLVCPSAAQGDPDGGCCSSSGSAGHLLLAALVGLRLARPRRRRLEQR